MKANKRRRSDRLNPLGLKKVSPRSVTKRRQPVASQSSKPRTFWQRILPHRWRRTDFTWRKFLIYLVAFFAVLLVAVAVLFAVVVRDLPDPRKLVDRPIVQSTKILDRNGKNLYSFYDGQNRTMVTGDQISPYLKQATISVEDATFYSDHGINFRGIARALYDRITHQGLGGGGSTITQQYIKNALLTSDETLSRKIKEAILAIEAEQRFSKDQILTGYLNEIPYGSSAYGIEAASQTYFGKSAKDLNLSEAATLASIPQAPTYYSPYGNHLDALFARKNYVLDRMAKVGFITQAQADQAKTQAPSPDHPDFKQAQNFTAQHFVFFVRQQMLDYIGGDPTIAEQQLDQGGYTVTTSLDLDVQNEAQSIVAQMGPGVVKKYNATNACLTAVDPKTGEVLAMVGSIDYEDSKSGNTNFCNAQLQPGSSFKPFVYATAFDQKHKYSPSSVLYDLNTDFGGGYIPTDYDLKNRGPMTIRSSLAGSLNIPAVKTLYLASVTDSLDTAKRLGISTLTQDPSHYGLSLVLGSGEVKPVEMANAYTAFANGGTVNALRPILKIEQNGKVVKDYTTAQSQKVLEPEVAYEINSILSDNNARSYIFGTNNSLTLSDRPVAAKSGTTNNNRDAWTVGYTPQISVAVWVGNNDPGKTMIAGADGSYVAAPIWKAFMQKYLSGKPVVQFTRPSSVVDMTVDKLSGKLPTDQTPKDDLVSDIFAPWQTPTARFGAGHDQDDVHIKVKIDKLTGKLANDLTPPQNIEEHTYFVVHSEVPDNPNWEGPVQAWAKANGGGVLPPTDTTDIYTDANRPTIQITSPTDGSTVSGTFTLSASPGGPKAITSVEFFINNVSVGKVTQAPWQTTYDAKNLPDGSQIITATVTNEIGLTASTQVTVTKGSAPPADSTPPGPVSSLNATNGHKAVNKGIVLTWQNPTDADLSKVTIYESQTPGSLGTALKTIAATPNTAGTTEIQNLSVGTYYFTLHTIDAAGNENQTNVTVSAQMLP